MKGFVNKIIPFSPVDGPGNRTVIFLQGCNFNCSYCHNPETINNCNNCGICIESCPVGALYLTGTGEVKWDSLICQGCDNCLKACPSASSPKIIEMTVNEVIKEIKKNKLFISGITVSGGECSLQSEFVTELFQKTQKLELTTYLDTNASLLFKERQGLLKVVDQAIVDLKAYDQLEHLKLTGVDNHNVIENLKYLSSVDKLYEVRTVVVPKILNNKYSVKMISSLIAALNPEIRYKLIQYRPVGVRLDMIDSYQPSIEDMKELQQIAIKNGCKQVIII